MHNQWQQPVEFYLVLLVVSLWCWRKWNNLAASWAVNFLVHREAFIQWPGTVPFLFLLGGHGSRGWYDNPQPALTPVLTQCTTPCVWGCLYVWVVCGYCDTDNVCLVSVRALYCIFIVPSLAAGLSRYQACASMPDRHRATQAHPPSQQGHSRLVLWWPDMVRTA